MNREKSLVQTVNANTTRFALLASLFYIAAVYSSVSRANSAPRLSIMPDHPFVVGEALTIPLDAIDADGLLPRLELISGPDGARLVGFADGSVLFHWIPTPTAYDESSAVIKVIDARNKSLYTTTRLTLIRAADNPITPNKRVALLSNKTGTQAGLTPIVLMHNDKIEYPAAPDYPALPQQSLIVNERFQMLLKTVDNNSLKVGIVSVDLPDGATISDGLHNTRVLNWIPRVDQAGSHKATIVVFKANAINSRQRIELTLNVLSSKPAITLALPQLGPREDRSSFTIVPASAEEAVPKEPSTTQIIEPESRVSYSDGLIRGRKNTFLPTYLTDPDYKIGESR